MLLYLCKICNVTAKNTKVVINMIKRNIESVLSDAIKHFPIILLTGPRQIGKSTTLYHSFLNKGYSYISLDDSLDLMTAKSDPRSFLEMHPYPLIIDEAQKAPELFFEIERIVNKARLEKGNIESNGMYILSGSQRKKLLDESQESLSGRVGIIDMSNLTMTEILDVEYSLFEIDLFKCTSKANRFNLNDKKIFEYIVRGFFPVLYDDKTLKSQLFYSSYLTTYLEKDIKDILNVADEFKFTNLLRLLASNTGQELVYDNYSKQVGVVTNTIKTWIAALIKTGIIYLVHPYNEESIVKRVVKRPKLYFFDTGLAAYLCGIDSAETLERSLLKGRFFETFVFNEIRKSFMNSGIIQELYYYRDSEQNEVDMVLIRNGEISCIEIKAGQNFTVSSTKGFKQLKESKLKHGKNAFICTADKVYTINDGTVVMPVSSI